MSNSPNRHNFDGYWLSPITRNAAYSRFIHRPVAERTASRAQVADHFAAAVVDHHVAARAVSGALQRRGFSQTAAYLASRLPSDGRTRTGNFGEVLASEHLRQRYGYDMPVFKLRFMDNPRMPMRGEDIVAFRLDQHRFIVALCVGESKVMQTFDSREVEDAHDRLKLAYRPHPVSLLLISNVLHDRGDALADQVDALLETLAISPVRRENWIFLITGNRPRDPFSVIQTAGAVVENLSCVDLQLDELTQLVEHVFTRPLASGQQAS